MHYLKLAVWPHPLVFDYGAQMMEPSPAVVVLLVLLIAATWWGRRLASGFAGIWFFLILAPTSSVVPVTGQPVAEHRLYLPLAAVLMLGVLGLHARLGRRSLAVCLVLAVGLGALTVRRNADYRSEKSLWADTLAQVPDNPRAHYCLGHALEKEGRLTEALWHYQEMVRLSPNFAEAQRNLGAMLRSADGAGVTGVVVPRHRSARISPTVICFAAAIASHFFAAGTVARSPRIYMTAS